MKASPGARMLAKNLRRLRDRGAAFALRAAVWKLKTAAFKKLIAWQERAGRYGYAGWQRAFEPPRLREQGGPRFGLLLPYPSEQPARLKTTLQSLAAQTHPAWTCYLLAAGSGAAQKLQASLPADARLKVLEIPPGAPPASWLAHCPEPWLGTLGCGDALSPWALAALAAGLAETPQAQLVYTDQDSLDSQGRRCQALFWPDWSPELLLSANYLSRAFVQRMLLAQGSDPSYAAALLRSAGQAARILHLPMPLVHLAQGAEHPWFAGPALPEALARRLESAGCQQVHLEAQAEGGYRAAWDAPSPLVSVIILNRDHAGLLRGCLEGLLQRTAYRNFEVIVVENNSREQATMDYYQELRGCPQVRLLEHHQPYNYSAFNNLGALQANGELLLFLNNDVEPLDPAWLGEMAQWAQFPGVGAVGARLLYPDGLLQHAGVVVGLEGHAHHVFAGLPQDAGGPFGSAGWYRNYSAVTGACLMAPRRAFEQVGGFDERLAVAFNDVDLCLRLGQAGWRTVYNPYARLIHYEGRTRANYIPVPDIQLGAALLRPLIARGDPFYNSNLTTAVHQPTFRRPHEESALARLDHLVEYS